MLPVSQWPCSYNGCAVPHREPIVSRLRTVLLDLGMVQEGIDQFPRSFCSLVSGSEPRTGGCGSEGCASALARAVASHG